MNRIVRNNKGMTLLEIGIGMTILASAMVALLQVMGMFTSGVHSETTHSDMRARTSGTLYDIVFELRQATANSPHFAVQTDPALPPSITFDLLNGIDAQGNTLWGNIVTYRLVQAEPDGLSDALGVVPGVIIRDEAAPNGNGQNASMIAADRIPYQYIQNGITNWGFTVSCNSNALTISISNFGDTGVNTAGAYQGTATVTGTRGTLGIVTQQGVYFLRNPQTIVNLN